MTLAQMRAAVKRAIGNRSDCDLDINTGLGLAVQEMVKRHAFKSYWSSFGPLTIGINDLSVALPVTLLHLIEVRILLGDSLRGKRLSIRDKGWVTQRMPDISQLPVAQPWLGYVERGTLYFGPPANQSYTLRGTMVVSPASAYPTDGTENPIPLSDLTQIAFATAYLKRLLGQPEQAGVWDQEFERRFAVDLKNDDDRKAPDYAMDDFSPRGQLDGYESAGNQPWLDPFYPGGSRRHGDY